MCILKFRLKLHGNPPGITAGGQLEQPMRTLGLSLKVVIDMIDSVVANINHLEIGQGVVVKELELPAGAKPDADENTTVVQVVEATELLEDEEGDSNCSCRTRSDWSEERRGRRKDRVQTYSVLL